MTSELLLELGMPHLGRHNLNESALFKVIGHDRWRMIEQAGKVRSADIRDEEGNRLYATFFFVELALHPEFPLSFYGENQRLHFTSDLSHHERVYLDGRYVLCNGRPFAIRASNVFIYQMSGPNQLAMAAPANMSFAAIPTMASPPDSLDMCRTAKQVGGFREEDVADFPLDPIEVSYQLNPDRDMNGAGLVYFANFICILDYAEREILRQSGAPEPLVDERSTYWRRIGYFGNAKATDALQIAITSRIGELNSDRLVMSFDYRVRRSSDAKEIVVSSARKVASLDPHGKAWLNQVRERG